MTSLVLCYADADAAKVGELARYLAANLPIDIADDECRVRPGFDLIDCAERGLSAEAALVILSPASVPASWPRARWEPVFFKRRAEFGTHLGFVLLGECRFPELLRREKFSI